MKPTVLLIALAAATLVSLGAAIAGSPAVEPPCQHERIIVEYKGYYRYITIHTPCCPVARTHAK